MRKTLRGAVLTGLVAASLSAVAGPASAAPSEYVAGYAGAGRIMATSTTPGDNCATRRAFYVVHTDDPETPEALRGDSGPGMGWVCVSKAAFGRYHVGNWWSGRATGPRG